MDLKLKRLLEQAQFTKYKGRGYDAAEVDDFLDRATAMAAKVEVQLTEALNRTAPAGSENQAPPPGPSEEEVEAEVERRVAARVAELPPSPAAAAAPVDHEAANRAAEESAEEARRTLLLAQRTADAAIREAREEAEKHVSEAQARAAASVSDAEAHAERLRSEAEAEVNRERGDARERLAGEIRELEQTREALRTDTHALERHVELQRSKVGSAIGELQRVLDDPDGIRLTPAPESTVEVPDLSTDPAPAATPDVAEPDTSDPSDTSEASDGPQSSFATPPPTPRRGSGGNTAAVSEDRPAIEEVDHEAPGPDAPVVDLSAASSDPVADSGPATAPVDKVDLDLDAATRKPAPTPTEGSDDDAFLTELRKAMADDEPLGPRDTAASAPAELFGEDRPRRFGRRR